MTKCNEFLAKNAADYEIIIVDDGSTDDTLKICEKLRKNIRHISIIEHASNLGIGKALKSGYERATCEYVCAIPGDGQFNPFELAQVKPFGNSVFYSFYRTQTNYTFYRNSLTVLNKLFNRFFLGISLKDVNWIKVYRKEQLEAVQPELSSSIVESEICAKLLKSGASAVEVPSVYHLRKADDSKGGSWRTLKKVILEIWKLYWVISRYEKR